MDTLALMRWSMPEISRLFPDFPSRFTVFLADDPMWRGGLSAPSSVYVHASRPLLSENGTSTLLHEAVHVGMGISATPGADWVIEGLAEYYSLQLLLRSGTIGTRRFESAIDKLESWGEEAGSLCAESAVGAIRAYATVVMYRLDEELRRETDSQRNLDDVMRVLASQQQKIKNADLKLIVNHILGGESAVLARALDSDCQDVN